MISPFHFRSVVLLCAAVWLLGPPARAQIDFSGLDKWRGWRPPQQREPRERPERPERPTEQVQGPRPVDPAEERARQKLRADKTRHLQSSWLPLAGMAEVRVPMTNPVIAHGSSTFQTKVSDPVGMLAPLGRAAMSGTSIATEALRRSVAILAVMKNMPPDDPDPSHSSWGGAEAAFLAGQAALAMEGAPLEVIVDSGNSLRSAASADAIRPALVDFGRQAAQIEDAGRERAAAYGELNAVSAGSSEEIAEKRERVMARFKKASSDKRQAQQQAGQDEIIILEASGKAH